MDRCKTARTQEERYTGSCYGAPSHMYKVEEIAEEKNIRVSHEKGTYCRVGVRVFYRETLTLWGKNLVMSVKTWLD
jgi:hypothetical protein